MAEEYKQKLERADVDLKIEQGDKIFINNIDQLARKKNDSDFKVELVSNQMNNLNLESKINNGNELLKPNQGGGRNRKRNNADIAKDKNNDLIGTEFTSNKAKIKHDNNDLDDLLLNNNQNKVDDLDDLIGTVSNSNN